MGGFRGENICRVVITLVLHVRKGKIERESAVEQIERERKRGGLSRHDGWFGKEESVRGEGGDGVSDVEHAECYVGCRV